MRRKPPFLRYVLIRRGIVGAAAMAAAPALATECRIGPPRHCKGPAVPALIEAPNYAHLEIVETLGNPYGPNGRAALALMQLARG